MMYMAAVRSGVEIEWHCVHCDPPLLYGFTDEISSFAPLADSTHLSDLPAVIVDDSFAAEPADDSFTTKPTDMFFDAEPAINASADSDSSMPSIDDVTLASFVILDIPSEDSLSDDSLLYAALATQTPSIGYVIIPKGSIH